MAGEERGEWRLRLLTAALAESVRPAGIIQAEVPVFPSHTEKNTVNQFIRLKEKKTGKKGNVCPETFTPVISP